jgi:hypothetical protein
MGYISCKLTLSTANFRGLLTKDHRPRKNIFAYCIYLPLFCSNYMKIEIKKIKRRRRRRKLTL